MANSRSTNTRKKDTQAFMEMLCLDRNSTHSFKTLVGAAYETEEQAKQAWASFAELEVSIEQATFILDLYIENDLFESIFLDSEGFKAITGCEPQSIESYEEIDRRYWNQVRPTNVEFQIA